MRCRCPTALEPQSGQGRFLSKLAEVISRLAVRGYLEISYFLTLSCLCPWVLLLRMLKHIVHQGPAYVREESRASL